MSSIPLFIGTPKLGPVQILPADTSSLKTLLTVAASTAGGYAASAAGLYATAAAAATGAAAAALYDLATAAAARAATGAKLTSLLAQSSDTSDRVVQWGVSRSGTFYPVGSITVPALSGNDGSVIGVNLLDVLKIPGLPVDADGERYFLLESGDILQAKALSTVTAAKAITLTATLGLF